MPEEYKVLLTAKALADLEGIANHIRQHSPQGAASMAERINETISSLASMPDRFRRAGKSRKRGTPVHSVVVRRYVLYYRVEQASAVDHVVGVRHGRRRQPKRFE